MLLNWQWHQCHFTVNKRTCRPSTPGQYISFASDHYMPWHYVYMWGLMRCQVNCVLRSLSTWNCIDYSRFQPQQTKLPPTPPVTLLLNVQTLSHEAPSLTANSLCQHSLLQHQLQNTPGFVVVQKLFFKTWNWQRTQQTELTGTEKLNRTFHQVWRL